MREAADAGEVLGGGLDRVAATVAGILGVPIATISTFEGTAQRFDGGYGLPPELHARTTAHCNPLCQRVQLTGKPVLVHDARNRNAPGDAGLGALDVVAYAGFPLLSSGVTIGVLAAIDHGVHHWLDRDVAVLRAVAATVSEMIATRDVHRRASGLAVALTRERGDRALLLRIAQAIRAAASSRQGLEAAMSELSGYLDASYADVVAVERERSRVLATARDAVDPRWSLDVDVLTADAVHTGRATSGPVSTLDGDRVGVVVPVISGAEVPALVRVALNALVADPIRASEVIADVSTLLAIVVEQEVTDGRQARRTAELEDLSIHDELTGLLNRRGFHAVAEGQLALARRNAMLGLVLFLDLDGLKATNDRAGHAAGDELLRVAARVLHKTFRAADTIGRLGGDEFVVFSLDTTAADLASVTARLAAEVADANLGRAVDHPLVWSIGVVAFESAVAPNLASLLAEADRKMYDAKRRR